MSTGVLLTGIFAVTGLLGLAMVLLSFVVLPV